MKIHTLYAAGPDGPITSEDIDHVRGGYPWIVEIRASSAKQALTLLMSQTEATQPDARDVVSVSRSSGPGQWPWKNGQEERCASMELTPAQG